MAAQAADRWTVAKDSRFEVYAQNGGEDAQRALRSFEQLQAFFEQSHLFRLSFENKRAVRVVGFGSRQEYERYRLRQIADAYYSADGTHDYIVMAGLPPIEFGIAAHEYTHYVLHAGGWKLPACLNEGLAEYFSTVRVSERGFEVGGDLPARSQVLGRSVWLALSDLFDVTTESAMPDTRKFAGIFYAESWALTDMLIRSGRYASHFRELLVQFDGGSNAAQAFGRVYGESLDEVTKDLKDWFGKPRTRRFTPNPLGVVGSVESHELSARETSFLLAQISLVSGQVEQAKAGYENLLRERPDDAEIHAALGEIAARLGNKGENLRQWREALRDQTRDAELCYHYALLAEEAGVGAPEVRVALERAVELAPDFDEARYKLGLLESQAGEYQLAVQQLRAMQVPAGARRFAYWIALAAALNELDEREGAKEAAREAETAAQTEDQRIEAKQIAYLAATDLKVQFVTDAAGNRQITTTRVEHGSTDFNPFIEPSDQVEKVTGELGEVLCEGGKLRGFLMRTSRGPVTVEVPDPLHVLIRNGPSEFYCGPVRGKTVGAEYAVVKKAGKTTNVLRGMTFQ
jgi:hypothetical protein